MWDFLGGHIWGVFTDVLYSIFGLRSSRRVLLTQDAIEDLLVEIDPLGCAMQQDGEQRYSVVAAELLDVVRQTRSRVELRSLVESVLERSDVEDAGVHRVRTVAARLGLMK